MPRGFFRYPDHSKEEKHVDESRATQNRPAVASTAPYRCDRSCPQAGGASLESRHEAERSREWTFSVRSAVSRGILTSSTASRASLSRRPAAALPPKAAKYSAR